MDIRDQAALLAAIVTLALAGAALLRSARPRSFTLFALLSLDLFVFSAAEFLHGLPGTQGSHDLWKRLAIAAGSLLPAAALAFFLEFLGVKRRPARRARDLMLGGSVFGLVVAVDAAHPLRPGLAAGGPVRPPRARRGALGGVARDAWRRTTRADRSRLTYVLVGALVVGILAFLDLLPRVGVRYPLEGLGFVALTLYMFLLLQALLRRRLLDLHEFLGKIAVVTLLGLVLASIYGGLVSWVGVRPGLFFFNTLVASFVILSLFDPIRAKVEEWVVVNLFPERYELVRELEVLRDRVVTVIDPVGLERTVLDGLAETRRVTHASLWLVADERPGYRLLAFRGPEPVPFLEPATARALVRAAGDGRRAVLLENLERRLAELQAEYPPSQGDAAAPSPPSAIAAELQRIADAREAMALMKAGICMPLVAGDRVAGFLACWDERVQEAFASDEIAGLIEVADRCALVIDNSKLYQQMKERDRLAALGEMAAGLAHEIRNPLAAIKGATQYLDPRAAPPRGRGVPRDHRRGGRPPERRRDPVPRLRPAAQVDAGARGRRGHPAAHLQAARAPGPGRDRDHHRRGPRASPGGLRSRAAEAGVPQPGAQLVPGHARRRQAPRLRLARPRRARHLAGASLPRRPGRDPVPRHRARASPPTPATTSSSRSTRRRRRAPASVSPSASASSRRTTGRSSSPSPPGGGAEFTVSLPCIQLEQPRPAAPAPQPESRRARKRRGSP